MHQTLLCKANLIVDNLIRIPIFAVVRGNVLRAVAIVAGGIGSLRESLDVASSVAVCHAQLNQAAGDACNQNGTNQHMALGPGGSSCQSQRVGNQSRQGRVGGEFTTRAVSCK